MKKEKAYNEQVNEAREADPAAADAPHGAPAGDTMAEEAADASDTMADEALSVEEAVATAVAEWRDKILRPPAGVGN